jgi:SAM-dependent methyltransferase
VTRAPEGWTGWDAYAAFYDWENARTVQRRDVPFWKRMAAAAGGPVLELGCGTGRISIPLARGRTLVVGIDRSAPMLARARRKALRARVRGRVRLVRGDIRLLPFRRRAFALVMAPYGILQSLVRERDLSDSLESVASVLPRGGRLAIDLVPDLPAWSEYRRKKTLSGAMGRGGRVTLVESVRQDRRRRLTIFDQTFTLERGRRRQVEQFTLTFRTLSVPEMAGRLERAGFRIDAVLGDYQGGPWDLRADVWIILARKR